MNYFDNLYTFQEIAVNNGLDSHRIAELSRLMNEKKIDEIRERFPELKKFVPYSNWYTIQGRNVLCLNAYVYDMYKSGGILPNLDNFDVNPDPKRLEHWQYINPIMFNINPDTGFEFAKSIYPDCDLWNLFLSGCARMDYYEETNIPLEQRIKYAIVEYMIRRPQFFTTEDFVDNEVLHKKYKRGGN